MSVCERERESEREKEMGKGLFVVKHSYVRMYENKFELRYDQSTCWIPSVPPYNFKVLKYHDYQTYVDIAYVSKLVNFKSTHLIFFAYCCQNRLRTYVYPMLIIF